LLGAHNALKKQIASPTVSGFHAFIRGNYWKKLENPRSKKDTLLEVNIKKKKGW